MSRFRLIFVAVLFGAVFSLGCGDDPTKTEPPDPFAFASETELIDALAVAYQTQDIELFELLFANNPECNAEFLFFLSEPTADNETHWNLAEELRLHRRMFDPAHLAPGEHEIPADFWLNSITITLIPVIAFAERPDLYTSDRNPGGLDPKKWRATDALYTTFVLFDLKGGLDFIVEGQANFIVIENLTKDIGTRRKFLIYRWEDIDTLRSNLAVRPRNWGALKSLYR